MRLLLALLLFMTAASSASAAGFRKLFNGHDLTGWEIIGDGLWTVMADGTLVGQRDLHKARDQSWLYTKEDFDEYDLRAEFWLRFNGNSGISLRDSSRASHAVQPNFDAKMTPSHIGYEIQLANHALDQFATGSVYLFDKAKEGFQNDNDWNRIEIEVRHNGIRVLLNGHQVSSYAGDPARPLRGPIGLQLHDPTTLVMFRNIEIRELPH